MQLVDALTELPREWAEQLNAPADARFTVRIEEAETHTETPSIDEAEAMAVFGMWRDRDDVIDVDACVRRLRAPRNFCGCAAPH